MSPTQQGLDTRSARLTASSSSMVSLRLPITCIYLREFIIHNSELTMIVYPQSRLPIADSQPLIISSSPNDHFFIVGEYCPYGGLRQSTFSWIVGFVIQNSRFRLTYVSSSIAKKCNIPIENAISLERLWLREPFMFKQENLEPEIRIGG